MMRMSWRSSITLGERLATPPGSKRVNPHGTRPRAVRWNQLSFAVMGYLAMTEIDWTVIGSALLLVSWFGFLLFLLYFSPAIVLP
jgi:hypothetical protein